LRLADLTRRQNAPAAVKPPARAIKSGAPPVLGSVSVSEAKAASPSKVVVSVVVVFVMLPASPAAPP
jgi:hypothetical protein